MAYYLTEINARCRADAAAFIADCDCVYAGRLELAADRIMENMEKSPIVLLSGPSGSGKTTTALKICEVLERRGVRTTLLDERSRITYVMPGETRRYPKENYFFFSAFPMEGRAEGVCEHGSYYELDDAELTAVYPLGVSNEYAEGSDCITISTRSGALVVVETVPD